jgi:uncharacterized protein YndB with AHSA1/START domain
VDVVATLETDAEPAVLFRVVADLGTYPRWLDIVPRADPREPAPGDPGPAWSVDLRGQLGPLRRSKRVRMVRSRHEPAHLVAFTRRELDGRDHSEWTLEGRIGTSAGTTRLEMRLHYGGTLWVPMLDRVLSDEIERSRPRLLELLAGTG